MNERRELLAAVRARLQRVAAGPDLSPVLEPEAIAETRQLAGVLVGDEGDLEVRVGCRPRRAQCGAAGTNGSPVSVTLAAADRLAIVDRSGKPPQFRITE
jgi:hypothetical protein